LAAILVAKPAKHGALRELVWLLRFLTYLSYTVVSIVDQDYFFMQLGIRVQCYLRNDFSRTNNIFYISRNTEQILL